MTVMINKTVRMVRLYFVYFLVVVGLHLLLVPMVLFHLVNAHVFERDVAPMETASHRLIQRVLDLSDQLIHNIVSGKPPEKTRGRSMTRKLWKIAKLAVLLIVIATCLLIILAPLLVFVVTDRYVFERKVSITQTVSFRVETWMSRKVLCLLGECESREETK
jgi:hypothetical protein